MAFEGSPARSNGSTTVSSEASDKPGGAGRGANAVVQMIWRTCASHSRGRSAREVPAETVAALNLILADTILLRDLYKKHHWQTSGATFYELHLLFDKHHGEQEGLVDAIVERIRTLGGISIAMAADVAEMMMLLRPPREHEEPLLQLVRLIDAHERVLYGVWVAARRAAALGDDGTNDLLVSDVIRTNEKQAWFLQQHLQRCRLSGGS